ncbi:hypothetical protein EDB89DRAFT_1851080, partial [Lactarius sanguifluus]
SSPILIFVCSCHRVAAPSNFLRITEQQLAGYKATALYAYTASPDSPSDISFSKDEILDIIEMDGDWWQVRKEDGTLGIAPSNHLQLIRRRQPHALDACTALFL